nr:14305_t:CDS:1 [Entrophospora candida]
MIKKEEHERLLRNIESEIRSLRDFQTSDSQDLTQMVWKNTLEYRKQSKNYNVYLFIEKIDEEYCNSTIAGNVITRFTNYGLFHVGLEIDGIIIEWGYGSAGSSIVCPRVDAKRMLTYVRVNYEQINSESSPLSYILSGAVISLASVVVALTGGIGLFFTVLGVNALAVILVASYSIIYHLGTIKKDRLKQIAEKCVRYNKTHGYNLITNNCQHFVDEVLESIGLKFKPEGEFKEFMDRIKYNNDDDSF